MFKAKPLEPETKYKSGEQYCVAFRTDSDKPINEYLAANPTHHVVSTSAVYKGNIGATTIVYVFFQVD